MKKEELIVYELPSISEYISIEFLQNMIARYTARKVNRKWSRYEKRKDRELFLSDYEKKHGRN